MWMQLLNKICGPFDKEPVLHFKHFLVLGLFKIIVCALSFVKEGADDERAECIRKAAKLALTSYNRFAYNLLGTFGVGQVPAS